MNNSRKLSLSDLVAKWRNPNWGPGDPKHPSYRLAQEHDANELEAALAQQAQPLTDAEIGALAVALSEDEWAKDDVGETLRALLARARDRMAQQAQPEPCIDHDLRIQRLVEAKTALRAAMPTRNRHDLATAIRLEVKCNPQWDSYSVADAILALSESGPK